MDIWLYTHTLFLQVSESYTHTLHYICIFCVVSFMACAIYTLCIRTWVRILEIIMYTYILFTLIKKIKLAGQQQQQQSIDAGEIIGVVLNTL